MFEKMASGLPEVDAIPARAQHYPESCGRDPMIPRGLWGTEIMLNAAIP